MQIADDKQTGLSEPIVTYAFHVKLILSTAGIAFGDFEFSTLTTLLERSHGTGLTALQCAALIAGL